MVFAPASPCRAGASTIQLLIALWPGSGFGGTAWNIITWYYGIPSSSSHALIGGLLGAALASAHGNWYVIKWSMAKTDPKTGQIVMEGLYHKVVIPLFASPIIGFVGGFLICGLLLLLVRNWRVKLVKILFGRMQLVSVTYMAWDHGFADGQKTMGIMALACFSATQAGNLKNLPPWLRFLQTPEFEIALWVKWSCVIAMALGTYIGGWKIIATMGNKLVRLTPLHGFAAETTGATLLLFTGKFGMPISTTHAIATAIMGVGCTKRLNALKGTLVGQIVWARVFIIPATGLLAYVLIRGAQVAGWTN